MLLRFKNWETNKYRIAIPFRLIFHEKANEAQPESKKENPVEPEKPNSEQESRGALERLKAKVGEINAVKERWGNYLSKFAQEVTSSIALKANSSDAINPPTPENLQSQTYAPQNFPPAQVLDSKSAHATDPLAANEDKAKRVNPSKLVLGEKTPSTGNEFEQLLIQESNPERRKKLVQEQAEKGNISFGGWSEVRLDPVKLTDGSEASVEVKVTNRFIGIGSGGYLPPVDGPTAKYLAAAADNGRGLMPTSKVVEAIIKSAKDKNGVKPLMAGPQLAAMLAKDKSLDQKTREAFANWAKNPNRPPGELMISPLTKAAQNKVIASWLKEIKPGTLTEGYLKTVGINPQMQDEGTTESGVSLKHSLCLIGALNDKGVMIQLGTGNPHNREHDDYSQGARAVGSVATLEINGKKYSVQTRELMNNGAKGDGWLNTLEGEKVYANGIYKAFADRPINYAQIYADIKPHEPSKDRAIAITKVNAPVDSKTNASPAVSNPETKSSTSSSKAKGNNILTSQKPTEQPSSKSPILQLANKDASIILPRPRGDIAAVTNPNRISRSPNYKPPKIQQAQTPQVSHLDISTTASQIASMPARGVSVQAQESTSETKEKLAPAEQYYRIGDSLTLGYSRYLLDRFARTFDFQRKTDHRDINSMSGKSLPWIKSRFERHMLPQMKEGSCIAILGGTNDFFNYNLIDDEQVKSAYKEITGHLKSMYALAHQKGIYVIAATIPPLGEEFKRRFGKNGSKKYERYIKLWNMVNEFIMKGDSSQSASERPDKVVPLHTLMADGAYPENMNAIFSDPKDKIHPNHRGYELMAEYIKQAVAKQQQESKRPNVPENNKISEI